MVLIASYLGLVGPATDGSIQRENGGERGDEMVIVLQGVATLVDSGSLSHKAYMVRIA